MMAMMQNLAKMAMAPAEAAKEATCGGFHQVWKAL
jgi:hypothetical protein